MNKSIPAAIAAFSALLATPGVAHASGDVPTISSVPATAQTTGAVSVLSPQSSMSDSTWTLTAGGQVSSGGYGSDRATTMVSAPIGVRWRQGPLSVSASLPFVSIRSPGVVFAGFDGTPVVMRADDDGRKRTRSDLGDLTLAASYDVALPLDVALRATGRVKLPLQGRTGVSTGKVDWSLGAEASRTFGPVTPFAAVSYRWFGDTYDWDVRDGFAASAGAGAEIGPGSAAVSYEYARSTSRFVRDVHEIVAVYDVPVGGRFRLAPYANVGLSSGAADAGAGLRLSLSL